MTKRPARQRRSDRVTSPDNARADLVACDEALAPFDEACRRMDLKWGVDRLPGLVGPRGAANWGDALANLNAAIDARDVQRTVACVERCLKGLAIMDQWASANGHHPQSPDVWEAKIDGFHFAILKDGAQWPALKAARPDIRYFTMREVANALKAYGGAHPLVQAAKAAFAQTEITAVNQKSDLEDLLEDEIPF